MTSDNGGEHGGGTADEALIGHMTALESNLKTIADDLRALGEQAGGRVREIENLATHVLAIEAVLAALLKRHPVDPGDVDAEVRRATAELSGDPDGSPQVRAVARGLARGAAGQEGDGGDGDPGA
ncbi:MAG: hypothetical protein H6907_12745 [Hyphomicrobiales bacterium]|nr:hypothetical protein [Hyphomicrobiales bacterium]MCP5372591.1 hypothetical protein [Hyphomicrobiales bacterium]